jgi:ABC-type uncharacterized transport system involved in gliding motility auxiliary subunit
MKFEWRRLAPVGLYLAIVAALASAGFYIVQRAFTLPLQISLGLVLVGLAVFALLDPERVREGLTGRQARYGSNALVMSVAFIGILVVINYLIYNNPKRWDLTENKQFTLAPETVDALNKLPEKVSALAFYTPKTPSDTARTLLDQYKFKSDGKFDYKFIDPLADPLAANQAGITSDGTVVLVMGNRKEQVTSVSEQELTGALIRLISPNSPTVYFLTGHGEFDPEGSGAQSYSRIKSTLEGKNYTVKKLNLLAENKIPDDAKLIVIAGPTKPVSEGEVAQLKAFVDAGGALIVMEEPLPVTDFGDSPDPLANYLSESWGITLGKDMVIDQTSPQPFVAVENQYGDHPVTQKMRGNTAFVTFFPTARSVSVASGTTDVSATTLVSTAQQSWAETDLAALTNQQGGNGPQIKADPGVDLLGPVPIAAAAQNSTTNGRVVVFGDADFVTDNFVTQYGNSDLFVNSVDWTTKQENLINLTPKETTNRLLVPPGRYTLNLLLLGSVFVLPGSVLLAGIFVWSSRRRRG